MDPAPLWIPVAAPIVWVLHFMTCYIAAALWCGRFAGQMPPGGMRALVLIATAAATAGIAMLFRHGLRGCRGSSRADTPEDRAHFVALTTTLLAGLSAIATWFVAFGMLMVPSCS